MSDPLSKQCWLDVGGKIFVDLGTVLTVLTIFC